MMTPAARSKARRFTLQALYQIQLTGQGAGEVEQQFRDDHDMKRVDTDYFHDLLSGIQRVQATLWETIDPLLDRKRDELDPVEKAVLLLGTFELQERIDVPYRVVINESIELARMFGASESHKFVNSILERVAKESRQAERR